MVWSPDDLYTLVLLSYWVSGIGGWQWSLLTQGRSKGYSWDPRRNQSFKEISTLQILDARFCVVWSLLLSNLWQPDWPSMRRVPQDLSVTGKPLKPWESKSWCRPGGLRCGEAGNLVFHRVPSRKRVAPLGSRQDQRICSFILSNTDPHHCQKPLMTGGLRDSEMVRFRKGRITASPVSLKSSLQVPPCNILLQWNMHITNVYGLTIAQFRFCGQVSLCQI